MGGGDERGAPVSGARRALTWLALVVLLGATIAMQRPEPPNTADVERLHIGLDTTAVGFEQKLFAKLVLFGKNMTLVPGSGPASAPAPGATSSGSGGSGTSSTSTPPPTPPAPLPPAPMPGLAEMIQQMSDSAVGWDPPTPPSLFAPPSTGPLKNSDVNKAAASDRLRIAILAGESIGPDGVRERLDLLDQVLDPASDLRSDYEIVRAIYGVEGAGGRGGGVADAVAAMDPAKVATFKKNHGVFAELALSRGDASSTLRHDLATQGTMIITVIFIVMVLFAFVLLFGLVMLILAMVQAANGKMRSGLREMMSRPEQQYSGRERMLFVETIGVFFAGFLGLKLIALGLEKQLSISDGVLTIGTLVGQWCLALTILWPVARGMTFARWRAFIGLTAPRGVGREIGAGVCGYAAWLTVYVVSAFIIVMVVFIVSAARGEPPMQQQPGGKITDVLGSGNPLIVALVFTLATMWAPLVEETVFRGMLFRTWRRPLGLLLAALGSAAVFAGVHGYMLLQVALVGLLGFGFALIREWRGSLIPCITAHCLHNFFVSVILIVVLSLAN